MVLFGGKSTDAWRAYGKKEFPKQGWVVRDGALVHESKGGGGDIVTKRRFRNFEFELQWKAAPKANSGIMYRVVETKQPAYYTGPEYQVIDDAGHGLAPDHPHAAGALYDLVPAKGKVTRKAGEWNDTRIVVVGQRIEHWLNGVKVVDVDFASDDYAARLAKSKFATWEGFGVNRLGHIALQDHGDEVAYRDIRVRPLDPEPARLGDPVVLFDGKGLDAFDAHLDGGAALTDVWSVRDGVLVCAGKPGGYLFTKAEFESYVLDLDWRFDPAKGAGNSGVLLRRTGEHRIWPRSIEAQLHSGNAGDFWNIGEFPMQVVAARTNGRNTKKTHGAEKPLGEWNRYRIVVDGPCVRLFVNGQLLNEAWDCEVVAGHVCFQSEGAEIHFRDIVLTPLR